MEAAAQVHWKQTVLWRQHLTNPAPALQVCRDLNGLQAQFPYMPYYALKARSQDVRWDHWGQGLAKGWTLRGTMHVFAQDERALYLSRRRAAPLREVDSLGGDGWISPARKRLFAGVMLQALEQGPCSREELKAHCTRAGLTAQEAQSVFHPWGGLIRHLYEQGELHFAPHLRDRLVRAAPPQRLAEDEAMAILLRRYLTNFGPASLQDASYYFGLPQRYLAQAIQSLAPRSQVVEGITRYDLPPAQEADAYPDIPPVLFLGGFDQLMLGYQKKQNPFLPPRHLRHIFTLTGIIHPAVLIGGEVGGRWNINAGKLAITRFEPLGKQRQKQLEKAAARFFAGAPVKSMAIVPLQ